VSPDDRLIAFRKTIQNVAKVFVGVVPPAGGRALAPETAQQNCRFNVLLMPAAIRLLKGYLRRRGR
jgi:hypothetical protein